MSVNQMNTKLQVQGTGRVEFSFTYGSNTSQSSSHEASMGTLAGTSTYPAGRGEPGAEVRDKYIKLLNVGA